MPFKRLCERQWWYIVQYNNIKFGIGGIHVFWSRTCVRRYCVRNSGFLHLLSSGLTVLSGGASGGVCDGVSEGTSGGASGGRSERPVDGACVLRTPRRAADVALYAGRLAARRQKHVTRRARLVSQCVG